MLWILFFVITSILIIHSDSKIISSINPNYLVLVNNEEVNVTLKFDHQLINATSFIFVYSAGGTNYSFREDRKIISPILNFTLATNKTGYEFNVTSLNIGSIVVGILTNEFGDFRLEDLFLSLSVVHSKPLIIFIEIIGWIYFFAWSLSFYPQVFINWNRKSVIGLNFDFILFNLTGFLAYSVFNIALFWIPIVKKEYHNLHPLGVNPVQANDVAFSVHAFIITALTLVQCLIYERGDQRVSYTCRILLVIAWLFASATLICTLTNVITWLTYVTYLSYVKLSITLIKYVPQAFMNFKRKATSGWSIGNVLLDLTGGCFSLFQMFLIAYNNDDWGSIFGDPTKFGLGAFSILFDILFIVQHYCLYRQARPISSNVTSPDEDGEEEDQRLLG